MINTKNKRNLYISIVLLPLLRILSIYLYFLTGYELGYFMDLLIVLIIFLCFILLKSQNQNIVSHTLKVIFVIFWGIIIFEIFKLFFLNASFDKDHILRRLFFSINILAFVPICSIIYWLILRLRLFYLRKDSQN